MADEIRTSGHAWQSDAQRSRFEAERRRIRVGLWLTGAALLAALFGLVRREYPVLRTPSGEVLEVRAQGRRINANGERTVLTYVTRQERLTDIEDEIAALLPYATALAARQGDDTVVVTAEKRIFRYGLLELYRSTRIRFRRTPEGWRSF